MSCILKSRNGHFCLSWDQRSSVINKKTFPDTVYKRQKHFHQSKIEFLYLVTHFTIFHPTDSLTASPSLKRWQTITPWGVVCWNQMYTVDIFISVPFPTKVSCVMKDCRKSWLYEDFADFLKYIFFLFFKFGCGSHDSSSAQFIWKNFLICSENEVIFWNIFRYILQFTSVI